MIAKLPGGLLEKNAARFYRHWRQGTWRGTRRIKGIRTRLS